MEFHIEGMLKETGKTFCPCLPELRTVTVFSRVAPPDALSYKNSEGSRNTPDLGTLDFSQHLLKY